MDTQAEDAAALVRALDAAPCHFAGLSMGGFIGMRLAARHPELARTLTLMNTTAEKGKPANRLRYGMMAHAIQQRLAALRARMDQMYEDKLDGKIDEGFWTRKMNEWREQERSLEAELSALSSPVTQDHALTVKRVFELANRAYFLYLTRNTAERGELLKSLLLNCSTDGASYRPTYRKPFD